MLARLRAHDFNRKCCICFKNDNIYIYIILIYTQLFIFLYYISMICPWYHCAPLPGPSEPRRPARPRTGSGAPETEAAEDEEPSLASELGWRTCKKMMLNLQLGFTVVNPWYLWDEYMYIYPPVFTWTRLVIVVIVTMLMGFNRMLMDVNGIEWDL